ncbi:MAG: glycosyltransferase family 39 protein [Chitinophagaceae bacterium]|nr:glycosyltransferase family 39 protein [Oligoflexus sp.]
MARHTKPLALAVAVILIYFTAHMVVMMMGLEGWASRPPLWDPATHALDSIHFARAFRHLSPREFFVQLHYSAMWPPAIPVLQAPFQMIFGETWLVSRNWTAWMAVPTVVIVFVTGLVSHKRFGLIVGAIAASLLAVSPHFQDYCLQEMLEVPGIFFSMLTLFFYISYLGQADGRRNAMLWRWTCLSGILLFFCKFNYAVIVMLPIVICEFCCWSDFRKMLGKALLRFLRDVRWRSGFMRFIVLYTIFLIYVEKVGIQFDIDGHRIFIKRALGNPTYLLLCIVFVRNYFFNKPLLNTYAKALWSAPEPLHSLLRFDVLPALVWLSYPDFFKTFFIFMLSEKTRRSDFWSMETVQFYPGALIENYAPHPLVGAVYLIALSVMFALWKRLPRVSRFIVGLTAFNLALTILHPNYQVRYLMTSVPMLLLVVALALVHLWEYLSQRTGARWDKAFLWSAPVLTIVILSAFPPDPDRLEKALIYYTQPAKVTEGFAAICRESKTGEKNTLVGFSNYMAPASIALQCYVDFPDMPRSKMPTTMESLGLSGEDNGEKIVASDLIDHFFVMDYSQLGFDVGRLQEAPILDSVKAALAHSHYTPKEILNQGPGGFRILEYSKSTILGDSSKR